MKYRILILFSLFNFISNVRAVCSQSLDEETDDVNYENPVNLRLPYSDFEGNVNSSLPGKGWRGINGTGTRNVDWKYGEWDVEGREEFGRGYVHVWRGNTICPRAKVITNFVVEKAGIYELRAFAYGANEKSSYMKYLTFIKDPETGNVVDTTSENSKHRIFFGKAKSPDSLIVHSRYYDDVYRPSLYSLYYIKSTNTLDTIELGFESRPEWVNKNGANIWGFGGVDLLYAGKDIVAFEKALDEDLEGEVTKAYKVLNQGNSNWLFVKLKRFIEDAKSAQTLAQKKNAIYCLKETMERIKVFQRLSHTVYQYLNVWTKDGKCIEFALDETPRIKLTDVDLLISTNDLELSYPLNIIDRFTFKLPQFGDGIYNIESNRQVFTISEQSMVFPDLEKNSTIVISSLNGILLFNKNITQPGRYVLPISSFKAGIYLVNVNGITYKFSRK